MALQVERFVPSPYVLYRKKPVSDVCQHGFVEMFYSKNDLKTGNLEFVVEGNADHLIVPSKTFLKLKVQLSGKAITPAVGTTAAVEKTIAAGAQVSVINNPLQSLFESAEVYLSNQAITKTDKHYGYTSFLQTSCNYGSDSHSSYFRLSGWSKDTIAHMDSVVHTENVGLKKRFNMFKGDPKEAEFIGKIFSPLFFQDKMLPTQVGLRVVLKKAQDNFILMHEPGEFKLQIVEAVLMVQKVSVIPGLRESYIKMLEEDNPIPYFFRTPFINYFTIEKDSSQFMRDDLFLGKIPRRIVIGMVDTEAYHGQPNKNPFNFQDFGLTEIALYKDGMPYPRPMIKLDTSKDQIAEAYHNFMSSLNAAYSRAVPDITIEQYQKGFTVFSYDMSPDQMGSLHPGTMLNMNSNIRLEMKFKAPLTKNITLLVYSEMEQLMEIHRDRRVTIDL
jgi:hypothetical protein